MHRVKNKCRRIQTRGFTLIETMVYLAVTVLVAGALVTSFLSLDTVLLRNKTERELAHSASVSLERIVREIRTAESINLTASAFGTTTGALSLVASPTTTRFYLSNGDLWVSTNGTPIGPLTSDAVETRAFSVHRYVGNNTEMVRIGLTLSASSKAASSTRTFYTSAILRGTYE